MSEDRTVLPEGWRFQKHGSPMWRATDGGGYTTSWHALRDQAIAAAWRIVDAEKERGE